MAYVLDGDDVLEDEGWSELDETAPNLLVVAINQRTWSNLLFFGYLASPPHAHHFGDLDLVVEVCWQLVLGQPLDYAFKLLQDLPVVAAL